jgi:hypothetical protein
MKQSSGKTENVLRPEDFPLGSIESRAVARALAKGKSSQVIIVHFVAAKDGRPDTHDPQTPDLIIPLLD